MKMTFMARIDDQNRNYRIASRLLLQTDSQCLPRFQEWMHTYQTTLLLLGHQSYLSRSKLLSYKITSLCVLHLLESLMLFLSKLLFWKCAILTIHEYLKDKACIQWVWCILWLVGAGLYIWYFTLIKGACIGLQNKWFLYYGLRKCYVM